MASITDHPQYPAYRHARRLIVAAGMGQALACMQARISERDYKELDRLYQQLPSVRHSNTRPHEEYGDAEPPSCLAGLVSTTREPNPLPADWAPPERPRGRSFPVEEEMGKNRGRPPWRRGDPGLDPTAELSEIERDLHAVEVPVEEVQLKPHHPLVAREDQDPGYLEDAAAEENTEEEQAAMSRGEWEEQEPVEEFAEAAGHRVIKDLELHSIAFSDQPSVFPGAGVQIAGKLVTQEQRDADAERQLEHHHLTGVSDGTKLGDDLAELERTDPEVAAAADRLNQMTEDVVKAWCRSHLVYEDVGYTCIKQAHSPLVPHEYVADSEGQPTDTHDQVPLTAKGDHQILQEEATAAVVDEEFDKQRELEEPWQIVDAETNERVREAAAREDDIITVDITPDLPATEPGPIPPAPDEVEAQKQKGIDQLEEKLEIDTSEFKRWKRQELKGYLELVEQGYDPDRSVHFRRLTPAQLAEVKRAF